MKRTNNFTLFLILCLMTISFSCGSDDESRENDDTTRIKLAMVLPLSSPQKKERYKRITDWFRENLDNSQSEKKIGIDFEWYDEETIDTETKARELAARDDVFAIIGPMSPESTEIFASICQTKRKPLISPASSSEMILRNYSVSAASAVKKPFLWVLSECDISQTQALLSKIVTIDSPAVEDGLSEKAGVALIASGDLYGLTFTQWVPFQISNMADKIKLVKNLRYISGDTQPRDQELSEIPIKDREEAVKELLESGAEYAVCAMSDTADVIYLLEESYSMKQKGMSIPRLFFNDAALSPEVLGARGAEGIEGVVKYADPTTGFLTSYQARYDELPSMGEPQLYDALLLSVLAAKWCMTHPLRDGTFFYDNESVQKALQTLTASTLSENNIPMWNKYGMKTLLATLEDGSENLGVQLVGATGPLVFDKDAWTSLVCTVYMEWAVVNNKFVPIDYTSEKGSERVSSMTAAWRTQTTISDFIEYNSDTMMKYAELTDRQALLIAASVNKNNLLNYRHQADVLNIYQKLKKGTYTDDKIILIIADDIAQRTGGVVKVSPEGENLYHDLEIDYKVGDLTAADIQDIITGNQTEALKNAYAAAVSDNSRNEKEAPVLNGNEGTNIFIFWSGHGSNDAGDPSSGYFAWGGKKSGEENKQNFTTSMLYDSLSCLYEKKAYRKVFLMAETCYALSVVQAMTQEIDGHQGFPGMISLMASNAQEESIADVYDSSLRTYMTNRFTKNVLQAYSEDFVRSFLSLYESAAKNTTGSHVQMINSSQFSPVHDTFVVEFFTYLDYIPSFP